jgi:hypothetical protein
MNTRFDDVCRALATPMSRRRVLQLIVGALIGGSAGLRPRQALAGFMCIGSNITCDNETECCYGANDTAFCCNKVNPNTPYCCSGFAFTGLCCTAAATCCTVPGPAGNKYCCNDPTKPECCNDGFSTCCPAGQCCIDNQGNASCCAPPRECCPIQSDHGPGNFCCPTATPACCHFANASILDACCATMNQCCILNGTLSCCPGNQECCTIDGVQMCCPADTPVCCPGNPNKCCPGKCSILGGCCPAPNKDPQSAYYFELGGTFVTSTGEKSTPGCQVCGLSENADPSSVTAATFLGLLEDYDFASRTLIGPVTFDALQGEVFDNGDVDVMAMGSGPVNGVLTNIMLMASETAGVITYSLFDADTMQELSGGTGETGTSSLELTITTP